jgi:hypothetical protein
MQLTVAILSRHLRIEQEIAGSPPSHDRWRFDGESSLARTLLLRGFTSATFGVSSQLAGNRSVDSNTHSFLECSHCFPR